MLNAALWRRAAHCAGKSGREKLLCVQSGIRRAAGSAAPEYAAPVIPQICAKAQQNAGLLHVSKSFLSQVSEKMGMDTGEIR